jgi:hypothetical protein
LDIVEGLTPSKRKKGIPHEEEREMWEHQPLRIVLPHHWKRKTLDGDDAPGSTGTFHEQKPWKRRNSDARIGYLGRKALRKEQCDMTPESRNRGARTEVHC